MKSLVEGYYEMVDEETYDRLPALFAADITRVKPDGEMSGIETVDRYFRTERTSTDTHHDVLDLWIVEDDLVIAKVHFSGALPTGRAEGDLLAEFHFDTDARRIDRYQVFRGYDR